MTKLLSSVSAVLVLGGLLFAPLPLGAADFGQGGMQSEGGFHRGPPFLQNRDDSASTSRGLQVGPPGTWWDDPRMAQALTLTADQQKRMDAVFLQSKLKLIDLTATLQKEELTLEPLLSAERPDATRVLAQIDRVAQARAELEKANGRMLFGLREVLTVDQWKLLQSRQPPAWGRWR